jgi:hypothetical protein
LTASQDQAEQIEGLKKKLAAAESKNTDFGVLSSVPNTPYTHCGG